MIVIMFILSVYLDLKYSDDFSDILLKEKKNFHLQSRLISKSLAYQKNHDKYKDIIKV